MIDPVIIQVSPVKDSLSYRTLEVSSLDDIMPLVQLSKKERLYFKVLSKGALINFFLKSSY